MQSRRLKGFASLSKYLEERRLYRRDERDLIVKGNDNLQDATRCLVNGISSLCTKHPKLVLQPIRQYTGEHSWMS
jgi:hypothetical protein